MESKVSRVAGSVYLLLPFAPRSRKRHMAAPPPVPADRMKGARATALTQDDAFALCGTPGNR
jgi:hypothetical protein